MQWIARGCVSDEALEQFNNPTTTGCTDEEDLPDDFRQGVIDATLGFYASVNPKYVDSGYNRDTTTDCKSLFYF